MKRSAGLLLYKWVGNDLRVFLVHPGGPFWAKRDDGAWSIPKGEYAEGEDPLVVARREFTEETGQNIDGEFLELGAVRQPGGKLVTAWAVEADCDAAAIRSNLFAMEWPPKSGRSAEFPEIDRAGWFTPEEASMKLLKGQVAILGALLKKILRNRTA